MKMSPNKHYTVMDGNINKLLSTKRERQEKVFVFLKIVLNALFLGGSRLLPVK